jgi:hypothetical protein
MQNGPGKVFFFTSPLPTHPTLDTLGRRDAKVAAALAKQPDLIAAYREKKRIKVKASPFDLFTLTTKELKLKARNIPQAKATKK